jgi:hypothetical protein
MLIVLGWGRRAVFAGHHADVGSRRQIWHNYVHVHVRIHVSVCVHVHVCAHAGGNAAVFSIIYAAVQYK